MSRADILPMLSHMAPKGTRPAELESASGVFWGLMVSIDRGDGEPSGQSSVGAEAGSLSSGVGTIYKMGPVGATVTPGTHQQQSMLLGYRVSTEICDDMLDSIHVDTMKT